jgi:hypothetical protein
MLQLRKEGVAYAHLTVPADAYAKEAAAINAAVSQLGDGCRSFSVSYLTGQSDLLLELRLTDFRSAFQLEYESHATGANWLFAVPFESPRRDERELPEVELQYVVHLRLNRDIYRGIGCAAEEEIVNALYACAADSMRIEVHAGFGWSDLIIAGAFTNSVDFTNFVRRIERLRLRAGGIDAVRRVLTLIGYDVALPLGKPSTMHVQPVIFVRALPTHIPNAVAGLDWRTEDGQRVFQHVSMDGKWDIVAVPTAVGRLPLKDFIRRHKQLAIDGTPLRSFGIERIETHLLSQRVEAATPAEPRNVPSCSCAARPRAERALLGDAEKNLPGAVVASIRNVVNLFRAASRDSTNCCDIVPSLIRCEIGLQRLVEHYKQLTLRLEDVADLEPMGTAAAWWYPFVAKARSNIEDWCTYAERIVSQRTVGRFEEFLAQNERVVSYRGGIQKLLYVADALLNTYARRVLPKTEEPAFMTLYDPIDTVFSMRVVGFVRVPARYVFLLPLAITHLWHEVGVYTFYARYWLPFDSRTRARLQEFTQRTRLSTRDEMVDLMLDVADVYGDAVTLTVGFWGDLPRFILSLASALFEQNAFQRAPATLKARYLVYLLSRLYLVVEYRTRLELAREMRRAGPIAFDPGVLEAWAPNNEEFVIPTLNALAAALHDELLDYPRYRDSVVITPSIIEGARRTVANGIDAVHRRYLNELASEMSLQPELERPNVAAAFTEINNGRIPALESDSEVAELFVEMQHAIIRAVRLVPLNQRHSVDFFHPIAALVRSSILKFYQNEDVPTEVAADTPTLANMWQDMADELAPTVDRLPFDVRPLESD